MKKQELYNILHKGEIIYHHLLEEEMLDIVDELSKQYYETGNPLPEDLIIEHQNIGD